ncbi:hypothetical protein BVRB_6g145970 [Beta vulgaris subsp. vulgaris]|nr:hypothetical protein BVRB_6g145970 [Beta vulgaris subsp. vulgaris]
MDANAGGEKILGKRKFDELNEVIENAVNQKINLVDIPFNSILELTQEFEGAKPTENLNEETEFPEKFEIKKSQIKAAGGSKRSKAKNYEAQPSSKASQLTGKVLKTKSPNISENDKESLQAQDGPPRRAAGRPPRPKRVVVQALVDDQFYNILHQHCNKVQAVSCDEAFLDITGSDVTDPEILVSEIRKEILESTCCTASVSIGANMLMARLATRNALYFFI